MPLLKSVVLFDVMKVVTPDHNRTFHFHTCYNASQNTAADAHIPCERALLVNIGTFNGLWRNVAA